MDINNIACYYLVIRGIYSFIVYFIVSLFYFNASCIRISIHKKPYYSCDISKSEAPTKIKVSSPGHAAQIFRPAIIAAPSPSIASMNERRKVSSKPTSISNALLTFGRQSSSEAGQRGSQPPSAYIRQQTSPAAFTSCVQSLQHLEGPWASYPTV